jgi:histidine triad (HIT) family protein
MDNCIFCKILKNEVEASFVYRGEIVSAFMDLHPVNRGHVLIVPNKHNKRFSSLDDITVAEMFKVGRKVLSAIESSEVKCEGANIFLSDGEVAGQEVPHSHLHIAPRFTGDGHRMGFSGNLEIELDRASLNLTAKEIRF